MPDSTPAEVGALRAMSFRVSCRVCGLGRDLWPDLIPGFLTAHEPCQQRATTVAINVPRGTDRGTAFRRWQETVEEMGFTALGEPYWHNADLSAQMGIDPLVVGDVARPA